jgi:hypothetical protein
MDAERLKERDRKQRAERTASEDRERRARQDERAQNRANETKRGDERPVLQSKFAASSARSERSPFASDT